MIKRARQLRAPEQFKPEISSKEKILYTKEKLPSVIPTSEEGRSYFEVNNKILEALACGINISGTQLSLWAVAQPKWM